MRDRLAAMFESCKDASAEAPWDPFLHFEPWDCARPSPETFAKAREDGCDLVADPSGVLAGPYPRPFQTGAILSAKKIVFVQAGSQVGKTATSLAKMATIIGRLPPYAMRYPAGADTGIKRRVGPENIRRWGRRDARTGEIIDHDDKAVQDSRSWDCGNITGVGVFPSELYSSDGKQLWIGTIRDAIKTMWWPAFEGSGASRFFPEWLIDRKRGNNGFNKVDGIVHCVNGIQIHFKTYDQTAAKAFESQRCWYLFYDEEPRDEAIYVSGSGHSEYQHFTFTPLCGITWSRDKIFGCLDINTPDGAVPREKFDYFHATQYDSPYQDREQVDTLRMTYAPWQRRSRVWGQYSEYESSPFFNRDRIEGWRKRFVAPCRYVEYKPSGKFDGVDGNPYLGLPGIFNVTVEARAVPAPDERAVWREYEKRRPGTGYMLTADVAEGGVDPEDAGDWCASIISRLPYDTERERQGQPVVCATLLSTLPAIAFARVCLLALRHWNNALLAPERGVGKDNEAFGMTLESWPYWYYSMVQGRNGRVRGKKGFNMSRTTRSPLFDRIRDILDKYDDGEDPGLRDDHLMSELAGAVAVEKAGRVRCDHTSKGSLDMTVSYGISCCVITDSPGMITCNEPDEEQAAATGQLSPLQQYLASIRAQQTEQTPTGRGAMGVFQEN